MSKNETTEKPAGLALLRAPFPENQISKKPQPMCSNDEWKKLPKGTCKECGGYHATSKTMHLSYVGHAALTDRLLDADPAWSWEPLAFGADGYPLLDEYGGMWIKLTVCGVTRLGYGDAPGKVGGNAVKERIGDALRNAAMRFGAGLDLWHKGDLHAEDEQEGMPESKRKAYETAIDEAADTAAVQELWKKIVTACKEHEDMDAYKALKARVEKRVADLKQPAEATA